MGWKWLEWLGSWLPSEFDLFWSGVAPSAAGYLVLSSQLSSSPSSPYSPPSRLLLLLLLFLLLSLLLDCFGVLPLRFLHLVVELDLFRAQARRVLLEEGLSDLRECGHNGCGESRLRENVVFGVESMSLRSRITEGKKRFLGIKRSSYTRIALERDNREEV
jgi:hypothetical protein